MWAICVVKADEMYDVAWTVFHNEMQDCDDVNNEVVRVVEYLSCLFFVDCICIAFVIDLMYCPYALLGILLVFCLYLIALYVIVRVSRFELVYCVSCTMPVC